MMRRCSRRKGHSTPLQIVDTKAVLRRYPWLNEELTRPIMASRTRPLTFICKESYGRTAQHHSDQYIGSLACDARVPFALTLIPSRARVLAAQPGMLATGGL